MYFPLNVRHFGKIYPSFLRRQESLSPHTGAAAREIPACAGMTGIKQRQGFSLVELSIVLVILGLLVGGILTGQHLVRAAELRSVTTELQQYQTVVSVFYDKYFALPGDMPNAVQFWGRADDGTFTGQCAAPGTDVGTGTQTCNGNRNGRIDGSSEHFRFWQHLANAGLIEGNYNGVSANAGNSVDVEVGINVPVSKFKNAGWSITTMSGIAAGEIYTADYTNSLRFGADQWVGTYGKILTPEEAWGIDTKMDDGKPGQGNIIAHYRDQCANATSSTDYASDYQLSVTGKQCSLYFLHPF